MDCIDSEASCLERTFNDNFVSQIIKLSREDYNARKAALSRLSMGSEEALSDDSMKKIFLRCYAKAFNHLYGVDEIKGSEA